MRWEKFRNEQAGGGIGRGAGAPLKRPAVKGEGYTSGFLKCPWKKKSGERTNNEG
jgi:hypothetical protein